MRERNTEPVYLTLREAAVLLRVGEPTLARWIRMGAVSASRTPGARGRFRILREDLALALQPGRIPRRESRP